MASNIGVLAHRAGAIAYMLWGLLHIYAAYLSYQLGQALEFGVLQSKVYQNAWNLAYLSILIIVVALAFNWRNSVTGYWLNLATVSAIDVGFFVIIYFPGHSSDLLGPALWISGAVLTTIGVLLSSRTT